MEFWGSVLHIIEYIFFIYWGFSAFYIFIFGFAGIFSGGQKNASNVTQRKFAVLIPGYKEDAVIVDVAKEAINQSYPDEKFDVIVIADSFRAETLEQLKKLPIQLIEVSFEQSTKSKALNRAMAELDEDYDVALVLDADNVMQPDFISKINQAFENGYSVVQGHRIAKNTNTAFAILDAISEEINNHIFRKGHRVLGFSSALIGSGMAFDYLFFKKMMSNVNAIGGFDKELELKLLKNKNKIEYLHDAIVLDEKVQKSDVFAKQRRRWLSAQFIYFKQYFFSGLFHLFFKRNIDFFDKVYQMIAPPRILLVGCITLITLGYGLVNLLFSDFNLLAFSFYKWLILFVLVILAFLFSIPIKFYNKETLKAILMLPKAFLIMLTSLLKLKGVNNKFIHTEHGINNKS